MKISFLTDIHVGNPKIQLKRLVDNLETIAWPEMSDSDLILLGGDFFDCLLNINSDAGVASIYIIDKLLDLVGEKSIYLRILRGTFSHDRYQNRLFVERASALPEKDGLPLVRVLDKIEVEKFPNGMTIVYCPDDIPCKDVTESVLTAINAAHLETVDYACCHGYWDHLLPPGLPTRPHNCLDYDKIAPKVKCRIFNGHVHTRSVWNKVVSGGSFERFRHGEEEAKGFYTASFHEDTHTDVLSFIQNTGTIPFITLDMNILESNDRALSYLKRRIKDERPDEDCPIHVRIVGTDSSLIQAIKELYPKAVVTEKKNVIQVQEKVTFMTTIQDLPVITEDNLPAIIYDNVRESHPEMTLDKIKEILHAS